MASPKFKLFVIFHAMFFLASAGKNCADEEGKLVKNINAYRTLFWDLPALTANKKAGCLANKIVETLKEENCTGTTHVDMVKLENYPAEFTTCIGTNQTKDGVVLPVCMPLGDDDDDKAISLLHNYTNSHYKKYIKDPGYSGIGVDSNDHWMVVVMNKNTMAWSSAGSNSLVSKVGFGHCLVCLFLGMLFHLVF